MALFERLDPDLVLLDLMLPKMSGIDVCRAIRARSSVPIIMVTAKGTEIDTVVGLEVGADDYVTKPYRLRELVARMRAVLRRSPHGDEPASDTRRPARRSWRGQIRVDSDRHRRLRPRAGGPPAAQGVRAARCCSCRTRAGCSPATP